MDNITVVFFLCRKSHFFLANPHKLLQLELFFLLKYPPKLFRVEALQRPYWESLQCSLRPTAAIRGPTPKGRREAEWKGKKEGGRRERKREKKWETGREKREERVRDSARPLFRCFRCLAYACSLHRMQAACRLHMHP